MTAKIWFSIIAGVVIAVTSTMALVYSPWFFPLIVVGIGLMILGFAGLSALSSLRGSRDYSRPKIFRSAQVDSLLAGTGYNVVICSGPSVVRLGLFERGFFVTPVEDAYGETTGQSFYLPEVDGGFSDTVTKRLYECVKAMRDEVLAVEQRQSKSRAFEAWVELSRRGK